MRPLESRAYNARMFQPQPFFSFTADEKRRYAAAIIKTPNEPLQAAISVFGSDPSILGKCLFAATNFDRDHEVIQYKIELLGSVTDDALPTKQQVAMKAWQWANQGEFPSKEKIQALRLYCDITGHIEKNPLPPAPAMPPLIRFVLQTDDPVTAGATA